MDTDKRSLQIKSVEENMCGDDENVPEIMQWTALVSVVHKFVLVSFLLKIS